MPTHTITFNLPEENEELDIHINAGKYYSCLSEFSSILRQKNKYDENQNVTLEEVRNWFYEVLENKGVEL